MSDGSLTSVETRQNLSRVIPAEIADIFGHPPVLSTENRQAYDALMTQLALEWNPRNIIGWMFVRDITDISWEIFRHRRAIANLFAISFKTALGAVLTDVLPEEGCKPWVDRNDAVEGLAQAWFDGPQEQEKVKAQVPTLPPITDELRSVLAFHVQHASALGTVIALAESRLDLCWRWPSRLVATGKNRLTHPMGDDLPPSQWAIRSWRAYLPS